MSSLVRSTQVPLQLVWPAGQHFPPEHVPLQEVPHAPQFLASLWKSTQAPPQLFRPEAQQMPVWQEPLHDGCPGLVAPEIGAQVPGLDPLQASQAPLQAVLQHTPSMQLLLWHSLAALHVCPVFFLHDPEASQLLVPLQLSLSSALVILTQVPPPPVQAWHAPHEALPQHMPSTQAPLAHSLPRLQVCPLAFLHAPVPSQVCVPLQVSSVVDFTGLQVPALPLRLQAVHAPVQAEPQHTPSAQLPLEHSEPAAHVWPLAFWTAHLPPAQ